MTHGGPSSYHRHCHASSLNGRAGGHSDAEEGLTAPDVSARFALTVQTVASIGWLAAYAFGALATTLRALSSQYSTRPSRYDRSEERRVGKECRARWLAYR